MRKILLGTTAVVGAALLTATVAQAQTAPTVRVGGFIQVLGHYLDDDRDKANGAGTGAGGGNANARDKFDFRTELEVVVNVAGKAANGLAYGAVIEMQNDNGRGGATNFDTDEAYIFLSSPTLGTIRFGDEDNAANLIQIRHPSVTNSGADGDYDDMSVAGTSLMTGLGDGGDSTKLIYLSPQFAGFDFGISYGANGGEGDREELLGRGTSSQRDRTGFTDQVAGAIRYRGTFGNVGVGLSLAGMRANAAELTPGGALIAPANRDITAYSVGASLAAFGITFGGEYTWGTYSAEAGTAPLAAGRDDSKTWTLGATYVTGPFQVGAWYGTATQDNGPGVSDRQQTGYGVGVVYSLAPGLDTFANYGSLSEKNGPVLGAGRTRSLSAVIAGVRLAF